MKRFSSFFIRFLFFLFLGGFLFHSAPHSEELLHALTHQNEIPHSHHDGFIDFHPEHSTPHSWQDHHAEDFGIKDFALSPSPSSLSTGLVVFLPIESHSASLFILFQSYSVYLNKSPPPFRTVDAFTLSYPNKAPPTLHA